MLRASPDWATTRPSIKKSRREIAWEKVSGPTALFLPRLGVFLAALLFLRLPLPAPCFVFSILQRARQWPSSCYPTNTREADQPVVQGHGKLVELWVTQSLLTMPPPGERQGMVWLPTER